MTLLEAAAALRRREVSSAELTAAALQRIERLNPSTNAMQTVMVEAARERAKQADEELARGEGRGPLHGIPIALKDLFFTKGVRTTGGSHAVRESCAGPRCHRRRMAARRRRRAYRQDRHARVGLRHHLQQSALRRGPQPVGSRPHPRRFQRRIGRGGGRGHGLDGHGQRYRRFHSHPRLLLRRCGIEAYLWPRQPLSAPCRWATRSTTWVRSRAPSAMPARCSNVIAGHDSRDETSSRRPVENYVPDVQPSIRGLRIGLPENFYFERLDPDVDTAVRAAFHAAESQGAEIVPLAVPDIGAFNTVARLILLAEASAVLEPHLEHRDQIGPDVLALLDQGRLLPATDYINAQRLRRAMQSEFAGLWSRVDCLFTPATPITAPRIGETTVTFGGESEDVRLAATRLVRAINPLGLPAVSVPYGADRRGLPVGLQIVGPPFAEALILRVAQALVPGEVPVAQL